MDLDRTEMGILKALQKDSRRSMRSLADELDVSVPTISTKIKELEDMGLIQGYGAQIDVNMLGLHTFVLNIDTRPNSLESVSQEILNTPQVRSLYELDGGSLMTILSVDEMRELDNILRELKSMESILGFTSSRVTGTFRDHGPVLVEDQASLDLDCYYCKAHIEGKPVKLEMDGKKHYLCCEVCAREYRKKYEALKKKSEKHR
ncbi:MAG: winged helix-turn-helix transcriptional regulator [Thermoplasmata archaeon]